MKTVSKIELIWLFILFMNSLNSQPYNTTTEVLSNGGGWSTAGNYENFGIIGETFSNYPVSGAEYVTSQGFFYICDGIPTMNEEVILKEVRIYPNPTLSKIMIELPHINSSYQILVIDLYGKVILYQRFQDVINLEHLSPGTYLLLIKDNNGRQIISSRIVKI